MQLEQQYEGRDDKPPLYGLPFSVKECIGVSYCLNFPPRDLSLLPL